MSMSKVIFVCVCLVGLTQLVWSQSGGSDAVLGGRARGVPGYLDPRTGTFTAKVQVDPQVVENPDLIGAGGTWNIELNIALVTKPAGTDTVVCEASLDVSDTYPSFGYEEDSVAIAKVSGSSATCTVTIPYLWYLSTPKTDTVTISYDVSLYHVFAIGAVNQANITRRTDHTVGSVAVPANGATTTSGPYPVRL